MSLSRRSLLTLFGLGSATWFGFLRRSPVDAAPATEPGAWWADEEEMRAVSDRIIGALVRENNGWSSSLPARIKRPDWTDEDRARMKIEAEEMDAAWASVPPLADPPIVVDGKAYGRVQLPVA